MATDQQSVELIHWAVSIAVPSVSGLWGVVIGAWLTGRRDRSQRRLAFVEAQVKDFYSPMLGLRNEIGMLSELRARIQGTATVVWKELCQERLQISSEALGELSRTRTHEFTKLTEYDNKQFREDLLPAYRQMARLFRENLWLADPDTREHYEHVIEFVEVWDRWLAKSIPVEVTERLVILKTG